MAAPADSPLNAIGAALKDLGWSHSRLMAELRQQARQEGVTLPDTPGLAPTVSRWINNQRQPNEFYRVLLSRAIDRPRWELFGDEAAAILRVAEASTGVASEASVSSDEDVKRRQLLAHAAALGTAAAVERLTPSPRSPMGREDTLVGGQAATGATEREIIAAIRRALLGYGPLVASGIARGELDVNALRRRVNGAWQLRQRARYVQLGRLLPGLLIDAQLASRELGGDDQARALTATAHAYNTTSSVLRRLGDNELALIAADRAVQAARSVDDPLLLAASAYRLANVFLPTGRLIEAKEVALSAAAGLDGRQDASGAHLAMWGSLLLTAALAAARQGDTSQAWELLGEGKTAAHRLGAEHADLNTIFGPMSLAISGVQLAAELEDGRDVLRRAERVDPMRLPAHLIERRSHFLIDVARGHAYRADDATAVATLLEVERMAPEEVRYNPLAGELVTTLLKRERRAATPELRGLSTRLGVVA
jgi:hypothetical protein